jgi:beta-apo-4'-carotenal oxygenase
MAVIDIPELKYTPVDDISGRVGKVRAAFHEHKTRSVEFRLVQLRKLYWA